MVLNCAQTRYLGKLLGDKLQDIGHHANVCAAVAHRIRCLGTLERGKLQGHEAFCESCLFEDFRLGGFGIVGRTKHCNHLIATL